MASGAISVSLMKPKVSCGFSIRAVAAGAVEVEGAEEGASPPQAKRVAASITLARKLCKFLIGIFF